MWCSYLCWSWVITCPRRSGNDCLILLSPFFLLLLIIPNSWLKNNEWRTYSGQIQKMAANNLMEARSPILWSTICDTAKESISGSLESEHSVKSIIEVASSANATAVSSVSDTRVVPAAPAARHTSRTTAMGGKHIRYLDKALPGMDTKRLYDQSFRQKSSILTQMRKE